VNSKRTVLAFSALAVVTASGCGGQSQVSLSPPPHAAVGFADVVQIPNDTPRWLIEQARRMATTLHDSHPQSLRIRLGRFDVIEIWGHFVCDKTCSYPDGAKPPTGTRSSATIDPRDHGVISFYLY
jgi:hypothetical protein